MLQQVTKRVPSGYSPITTSPFVQHLVERLLIHGRSCLGRVANDVLDLLNKGREDSARDLCVGLIDGHLGAQGIPNATQDHFVEITAVREDNSAVFEFFSKGEVGRPVEAL
ncbi:MAG: hypothetical protein EBT15_00360 [Betaproteobacteria bacterium]|nr:hypothetical protein [Betaproteobacteria bacterium]